MLKVGKLDSNLLQELVFDNIKFHRPEVIAGGGIGEDCAVIDFGQYECIMSTDPITAAISDVGRLSIHISCNDIASNGVAPLGIMLAVLLPIGTKVEDVVEIMKQAAEASASLGVEIIGGHTEITSAVNKPVIVSTAIGRRDKSQGKQVGEIKIGDVIFMTKSAGIEGAGIIAKDKGAELEGVLEKKEIATAKNFLNQVSVVKEGVIAGKIGVSAMHDITEGGVLGAIWELCHTGGLGATVYLEKIPVSPISNKICKHFEIDYLRLISSGSMIIVAAPQKKESLIEAMSNEGIELSEIGVIEKKAQGINMCFADNKREIEPPSSDEIYKVVD